MTLRDACRALVAAVVLLGAGLVGPAHAQVSPGPLSAAHGSLDGATACYQCHPTGGGSGAAIDPRCLACHTEIAAMRTARRGFHAAATKPCATCHPDHGGRDFKLIDWPGGSPEAFDHKLARWDLEGAHAKLECVKCHTPKNQKGAVMAKVRKKDPARSWLGLEQACTSCHTDPHRDQLGRDCRKCHGLEKWKPAPAFDHDRSDYPLTGAHARVECAKCHAMPAVSPGVDAKGSPIPQWKPLAHKDCVSCHKDPHAGRFPGACSKCHQTSAWATIRSEGFNHDLTRYPLRGAHAAVKCASCHDERTAFGAKPKFDHCGSCHKDAHNGGATLAGKAADCESCHDLKGFAPSTFTVAEHAKTKYPLEGAHTSAVCKDCHARAKAGTPAAKLLGPSLVVMRPKTDACQACHRDPHEGRFSAVNSKSKKLECRSCHSMDRFHPSIYDAEAHQECIFKLAGAHVAVPCADCHGELRDRTERSSLISATQGQRTIKFESDKRKCAECHQDPHGTQFASTKAGNACDRCHGADAFAPAVRFDHHKQSAFKLDGAHEKVPCAGCHPTQKGADGVMRVVYRPLAHRCLDCHADGVPTPSAPSGMNVPRTPSREPRMTMEPRMEAAHVTGS